MGIKAFSMPQIKKKKKKKKRKRKKSIEYEAYLHKNGVTYRNAFEHISS